jgi:hypothetical protein
LTGADGYYPDAGLDDGLGDGVPELARITTSLAS